uniref:Coatomer subunit gamma n=1 Tax=Lotharella globosa TaxID=91324 RepID=A0A6V3PUR7_9EUKA|mmetsp:Transcript_13524/g.27411  ORF Transcript_13524/g.27411 Transcript_13524/m.27411 type:complete len:889 (+) Transcript_13524:59-2725(+)
MEGVKTKGEDGEAVEPSPYDGIQKNAVLHEAKCFNDKQISARTCSEVLTKIMYLIIQGEEFSPSEISKVFFSVTKLFNSRDVHLRRMVYLSLKNLPADPEEAMMVVNCLAKDMTGKTDLYRANAIRVLAKILHPSMIGSFERFMKQAIIDKDPYVVSAALLAGNHMLKSGADSIKRWSSEVQEALNNPSPMVQLHALLLLFKLKQYDPLAISKLASNLARAPPKGPLAQVLLIRCIASVIRRQPQPDRELLKFLQDLLHDKSFTVMYEAARTICALPNINRTQVISAIGVLQEFLSSPVAAQRFAAVRTLSKVVLRFPIAVAPCSVDLEHLINDSNRNVATIAITTLLRTGVEQNVDRLMKSIAGFMTDTSDEFKIVLIDAIKSLCLKFKHRHKTLLAFLSASLREEGGKEYKRAIMNAILEIIEKIPETKETGLEQFCEFIEDCEFPKLSMKILDLLGTEGPKTKHPGRYIRFIFNRVILETASVRSAAVTALARFGAHVPELTPSIRVLLSRCAADDDDEVRDRAVLFLHLLQGKDLSLAQEFFKSDAPAEPKRLTASLEAFLQSKMEVPFDVKKHLVEVIEEKKKVADEKSDSKANGTKSRGGAVTATKPEARNEMYKELLNKYPYFSTLGKLFKSCAPVELTESETEYVVSCVKHIYKEHVVLQFNVTNNMEDQLLENVTVEIETEDPDWAEEKVIAAESIAFGTTGVCFVCISRPIDDSKRENFASGTITNVLKFLVKDVEDGVAQGVATEDEYTLEDLEVVESDFMQAVTTIRTMDFKKQWDSLSNVQAGKKFSLGLDDLQSAVDAVIDLLGMGACESMNEVAENARSHGVFMVGKFLSSGKVLPVLCKAGFMLDQRHGVTLKIAIRCPDANISKLLTNSVR